MSFTAQPEMLAAAAGELRSLGATLKASNAAAAVPTTGVVPPAADEVSLLPCHTIPYACGDVSDGQRQGRGDP